MTVKITKPSINVREKLSELDKETGIKGEELMRADTSAEAREALQLDQQLFTDFESTGIDDNATSTAMTLDSSGNVGINESNPQELLHLTDTTPVFRMEGASRTYQQYVSGTSFFIRDVTAGLNRVTLDSSGTVTATAFSGDGSGLTGVGGGAWELISTTTASNVATLDINGLSNSYVAYKFISENVYPASADSNMYCHFNYNGTIPTSNYQYALAYHSISGGAYTFQQSTAIGAPIAYNSAATANYPAEFEFTMQNPSQSSTLIKTLHCLTYGGSSVIHGQGIITYPYSSAAVTGIRLYYLSKNIYGTVRLYGLKGN